MSAKAVQSLPDATGALARLAGLCGIAAEYEDQQGKLQHIDDDVLVRVLGAMGVPAKDDAQIGLSLKRILREQNEQLCPPTIVQTVGNAVRVPLRAAAGSVRASLKLEDGTDQSSSLVITSGGGPDDGRSLFLVLDGRIPIGYHELTVSDGMRSAVSTVIAAPGHIDLPAAVAEHPRWGWMVQLYSVRSPQSWGVGDFGDLRRLLVDAADKTKADFMLINPIHAAEPVPPMTPSPYFPASRVFINPLYIRPELIDEYQNLSAGDKHGIRALLKQVSMDDTNPDVIDRDHSWKCKEAALRIIYDKGELSQERAGQLEQFIDSGGVELKDFALWCLAYQCWGRPESGPDSWFHRLGPDSVAVSNLLQEHHDDFDFYVWMQWVADQQLEGAQRAARDAGMAIGLMEDMAVGVNPLGADVWSHPESYASGATVGAPPDAFNQQGQNWMQPPLDPMSLQRTGFSAYRQLVHAMFAHCGAVRIDHALGLFRLWWIPDGLPASQGAYVTYDQDAMLAVWAIEATRSGGLVIGEDLGVVPPYASQALAERGILGTVIEWFEQQDGRFTDPAQYRQCALAAVTTHDLPPTAGYLRYEHVRLREKLHLLNTSPASFEHSAKQEHAAMLHFLQDHGWLDKAAANDEDGHMQEIVQAMHCAIAESPCLLKVAALVDGVGEARSQNQPGTVDEYPNWRVPLADEHGQAVSADKVFDMARVRALARIMQKG